VEIRKTSLNLRHVVIMNITALAGGGATGAGVALDAQTRGIRGRTACLMSK